MLASGPGPSTGTSRRKRICIRAVVEDRIGNIVDEGRKLAAAEDPDGLFTFLRTVVLQWGATDRGLADSLAGVGIDIESAMPDVEEDFLRLLGDLLRAGQKAGTVRRDVDVRDVKAILSGCLAMLAAKPDAAELLTDVVLDGLRGG